MPEPPVSLALSVTVTSPALQPLGASSLVDGARLSTWAVADRLSVSWLPARSVAWYSRNSPSRRTGLSAWSYVDQVAGTTSPAWRTRYSTLSTPEPAPSSLVSVTDSSL